ncbi:MAG: hypothetical protein M3Y57_09675 [Acidobacteriota bacterium]|nr:hypothetical protein [Acidobacteriota bacterium]
MRKPASVALAFLACAATLSSKDKSAKVPFHDMAVGMRDAFNCGVVVEKYLHGSLKGNVEAYHQLQAENNCGHVEAVLGTLHDEAGSKGKE